MRLPPLNAFRFFEAAGRHRNFSRAADELHLTHGAVSQQIRTLEEALGTSLFKRAGAQMNLTPAGARLLEHVQAAFAQLRQGVTQLQQASLRHITVSAHPPFASRWLVPRLPGFLERHADIEVLIRPTLELANFRADGVDVAIRFGPGGYAGLVAQPLFEEELFPVCAPRFEREQYAGDLATVTLLHDERFPWSLWFDATGVPAPATRRPGLRFTDASMLIGAAIDGQGVALARGRLCAEELRRGTLVRLSPLRVKTGLSYWLVHPDEHGARSEIAAFTRWLADTAGQGAA